MTCDRIGLFIDDPFLRRLQRLPLLAKELSFPFFLLKASFQGSSEKEKPSTMWKACFVIRIGFR